MTAIATIAPVLRPLLVLELAPATNAVCEGDAEAEDADRLRELLVDADGTDVIDW